MLTQRSPLHYLTPLISPPDRGHPPDRARSGPSTRIPGFPGIPSKLIDLSPSENEIQPTNPHFSGYFTNPFNSATRRSNSFRNSSNRTTASRPTF